jgi:hypothetical protein
VYNSKAVQMGKRFEQALNDLQALSCGQSTLAQEGLEIVGYERED